MSNFGTARMQPPPFGDVVTGSQDLRGRWNLDYIYRIHYPTKVKLPMIFPVGLLHYAILILP
jgi:hypothetical protein